MSNKTKTLQTHSCLGAITSNSNRGSISWTRVLLSKTKQCLEWFIPFIICFWEASGSYPTDSKPESKPRSCQPSRNFEQIEKQGYLHAASFQSFNQDFPSLLQLHVHSIVKWSFSIWRSALICHPHPFQTYPKGHRLPEPADPPSTEPGLSLARFTAGLVSLSASKATTTFLSFFTRAIRPANPWTVLA